MVINSGLVAPTFDEPVNDDEVAKYVSYAMHPRVKLVCGVIEKKVKMYFCSECGVRNDTWCERCMRCAACQPYCADCQTLPPPPAPTPPTPSSSYNLDVGLFSDAMLEAQMEAEGNLFDDFAEMQGQGQI